MSYPWPTILAEEVLSGKGAETTGQGIFNQQQSLKQIRRFSLAHDELSSVATTQPTGKVLDMAIRIPGYAESLERFYFSTFLRKSGGGTAFLRVALFDGTAEVLSAQVSTTSASYVLVGPTKTLITTAMRSNSAGRVRLYLWTDGAGTALTSARLLFFNCKIDEN